MNLCSDNHAEICFEGRLCPLCAAIQEHEKKVERLEEDNKTLSDEVQELQTQLDDERANNS